MIRLPTLALAALWLLGWTGQSAARIHGQMYCWALDSELPIPCDAEEEDDEGEGAGCLGAAWRPSGYPTPDPRSLS
jgi:hypothetical protein